MTEAKVLPEGVAFGGRTYAIVDGLTMPAPERRWLEECRAGGIRCVNCSVAVWENAVETMAVVGKWRLLIEQNSDIVAKATSVAEIEAIRKSGRTAMTSVRRIAQPWVLVSAALAFWVTPQVARAQAFPVKAVRIVIPFSPGGSADLQARTLGQKLTESWGQSVVIEAKPGAGTTIGAAYAASSPPDGYTLYFAGASLLISGNLYKNLSYDAVKSFAPVSMVADSPYFLVVHPSVPTRSVKALIDLAKARPKALTYASAGTGSGSHLAGELFRMQTGIEMVHVPYKGQAPAIVALAGGEVSVLFADVAAAPYIQAGRINGLAVTSDKRAAALPGIPTIGEAGLPTYQMSNWGAILAPAGTPRATIVQINAAIVQALTDAEIRQRFSGQGFEAMSSTPEALGNLLVSEYAKYARVIKESGMKIE